MFTAKYLQKNLINNNLIILIFILAFVIRFYVSYFTAIINSDGVVYIHQARLIYDGQFNLLTSCGLSYVPINTFLIALSYFIFQDWLVSAKFVSLFFAEISLIALYFFLRKFFSKIISSVCILIFAVIPILAVRSADILREPIFWFFLSIGFYFFVYQERKNFLLFSNLAFLMACWARIESFIFIIGSLFYILMTSQISNCKERIKKLMQFCLPIFILSFVLIIMSFYLGISVSKFIRILEIQDKITEPFYKYMQLKAELLELSLTQEENLVRFFLPEAKKNLWLIALCSLFNNSLEAFFYPFFLIFVIGLYKSKQKILKNDFFCYFFFLVIAGFILLYFHIIHTWIIDLRFLSIIIFPSSLFISFGIKEIIKFFVLKHNFKIFNVVFVLCFLILISSLPKDLKYRETDKLVFKEIAQLAQDLSNNQENQEYQDEIKIATSNHTQRIISFYANLSLNKAVCPQQIDKYCWEKFPDEPKSFIFQLKQNNVKYFLWEEKHWFFKNIDLFDLRNALELKEIRDFSHKDTGQMVLFTVK